MVYAVCRWTSAAECGANLYSNSKGLELAIYLTDGDMQYCDM